MPPVPSSRADVSRGWQFWRLPRQCCELPKTPTGAGILSVIHVRGGEGGGGGVISVYTSSNIFFKIIIVYFFWGGGRWWKGGEGCVWYGGMCCIAKACEEKYWCAITVADRYFWARHGASLGLNTPDFVHTVFVLRDNNAASYSAGAEMRVCVQHNLLSIRVPYSTEVWRGEQKRENNGPRAREGKKNGDENRWQQNMTYILVGRVRERDTCVVLRDY